MRFADSLIVYHSEGEQLMDQWLWNEGGFTVLGWIAGIGLIVLLMIAWYDDYQKRQAYKRR